MQQRGFCVCKCLINQNPEQIKIRSFLHQLVFGEECLVRKCWFHRNGGRLSFWVAACYTGVANMLQELSVVTAALQTERRRRRWQQKNHGVSKVTISLQTCYDRSFLNLESLQSSEQSEHWYFCALQVAGGLFQTLDLFCFTMKQSFFSRKTYRL